MPWGKGRPVDQERMLAGINGERTYRGTPHGCGTNERYTNGGACVFCARRIQREQRQARAANISSIGEIEQLAADMDAEFFNAPTAGGDPWD